MARKSRLIYPGIPHHAIQRGNNRQEIFLEDGDRHYYLKWMLSLAIDNKVPIIGYCLMTYSSTLVATNRYWSYQLHESSQPALYAIFQLHIS
jgi:putative transposase